MSSGLRVTARLARGAVIDPVWPLPFDALLATVVLTEEFGRDFARRTPGDPGSELVEPLLPLERVDGHGGWWWAASCAEAVGPVCEEVEWFHSRNDLEAIHRRVANPPSIDPTRHRFKQIRQPSMVTVSAALTWRVAAVDPAEVERLTSQIGAVGKRRNTGAGHVIGWDIDRVDVDDPVTWACWDGDRPSRPMLPAAGWGGAVTVGAIRAPYWLNNDREVMA